MRRKIERFPVVIFIVAFSLRLVPVVAMRSIGIGLDDMFQYDMLARSLSTGNGFRWYAFEDLKLLEPYIDFNLTDINYDPIKGVETSFRAPLYPSFLALIYLIAGLGTERILAARIAQSILGALLPPLTYWIALRILPDNPPSKGNSKRRIATISAWIIACYPLLILYPFGLATENLFFPLVLGSIFFLLRATEKTSKYNFILAGFGLGLAALTRSIILLFAGVAILWILLSLNNRRGAILFSLALLITIVPWVIRNSFLHNRVTGLETSMGYNLYVGYHPKSDGSFTYGISLDLLSILDDAERDRIGTAQAFAFIRDAPERVFTLALNRLRFFFGLEKRVIFYFYGNNFLGYIPLVPLILLLLFLLLPFPVIVTSASLGIFLLPRQSKMQLILAFFAAYIVPHILILSEDRFHLAIVPMLSILAAHTWTVGFKTFHQRWSVSPLERVLICLSFCFSLLLVINWAWDLLKNAELLGLYLGPGGNTLYLPY